MKVVIKEMLEYKKSLIMHLMRIIIDSLNTLTYLYFVKVATNAITYGIDYEKLLRLVGIALIDISAQSVTILLSMSNALIFRHINNKFTTKVLHADYDMYTEISCSAIVTASGKIQDIAMAGNTIFNIIKTFVKMIITLVMIGIEYPALAIIAIPVYIITCFICKKLTKKWGKYDEENDKVIRKRNHELDAVINGFNEVRSYQTEKSHANSIYSKNNTSVGIIKKRKILSALLTDCYWTADYGISIVSIFLCSTAVIHGNIDVASAITVFMYVGQLINPLSYILDLFDDLTARISVLDDYNKIINYENKMKDGTVNIDIFEESIELKNVSFKYKDSGMVLQNVNMIIPKGKHIGICGSSGCGKSSLFKLLEKFYQPCDGTITIDGIDFNDVTNKSLRSHMAIVSQDPYIFDGTIFENLVYGSNTTSEDRVKEICEIVSLNNFINELPEGYQTKVGPRGLKLSGGQCQRVAFARALLRNSDILLLDEATSALDNISESIIQDALTKFKGLTIVTIAHRLTTIKNCDCIYVFAGHTVVDHGTHSELMQNCEVYRNLTLRKQI